MPIEVVDVDWTDCLSSECDRSAVRAAASEWSGVAATLRERVLQAEEMLEAVRRGHGCWGAMARIDAVGYELIFAARQRHLDVMRAELAAAIYFASRLAVPA